MLRRLFALALLLALVAGGLYYWKAGSGGFEPRALGKVGQALRDTRTTAAVKAALELNRHLKPLRVAVSTEAGVVTLRGDVPREELKTKAEQVAGAVPDVRQVVNHLRVVPGSAPAGPDGRSVGESLDDEAVTVQVRLALSLRRELEGADVSVRAFRRQVTLTGELARAGQREVAVETTRATAGVEGVTDELRVRGAGADALAVQRALRADPNLGPYALEVREEGGRLVLRGRVRTGAEKELAGLLAREAAGGPIENVLQIRP